MERNRLKENFDLKVNERNILGTQLIRRQQELHLLYEKIKIQQSRLKKGEIQYSEKLHQIADQKSKIADLMAELKQYTIEVSLLLRFVPRSLTLPRSPRSPISRPRSTISPRS